MDNKIIRAAFKYYWPICIVSIFLIATYKKDPQLWSVGALLTTLAYGLIVYSKRYGLILSRENNGEKFWIAVAFILISTILLLINILTWFNAITFFDVRGRVWFEVASTLIILSMFILIDNYLLKEKTSKSEIKEEFVCSFDFLIVYSNLLALISFILIIFYMIVNGIPMVDMINDHEEMSSVWIGAATFSLLSSNIFFNLLTGCQDKQRKRPIQEVTSTSV